jgi:ABC-2 type transport system permease protein
MNQTLMIALMRQRLASPVRLALLSFAFGMPLLFALATPGVGFTVLGDGYVLTLVIAAGVIGQDVSSGVLQLVLARPVTRGEYVVSRWLAIGLMSALLVIVQVVLCALALSMRHAAPEPGDALGLIGDNILCGFGAAAVITLFSSLLAGLGDLALLLIAGFIASGLQGIGQFTHSAVAARAGLEVQNFVVPHLPVSQLFRSGDVPWFAIVSYFSTVTLCLALAIVAVNRKELSYAASA